MALPLPYMEMEQNQSFSDVAARDTKKVTSYLHDMVTVGGHISLT